MSLKQLTKEERKAILVDSFIISLPSTIFIIPLSFILILASLIDFNVEKTVFAICLLGIFTLLILHDEGYVFFNLIANNAKIYIEEVSEIKTGTKKVTIPYKNRQDRISAHTEEREHYIVSTFSFNNVPSIYPYLSENMSIGEKVFIIELKNGEKYALDYKRRDV